MPYTYDLEQLNSNTSESTSDGLRNIANAAANFVCDAYQNYATATTGFPDPTGIGALNNALFSRLCAPRNKLPPTPTQPFTGGQCAVRYNVAFSYTDPVQGNGSGTLFNLLGPITGVRRGASGATFGVGAGCAPESGRPDGIAFFVLTADRTILNRRVYTITSVSRVDGQPDNCGNPVPQFGDKGITNNYITNNNKTVNVGGGVSLTVPIFYTPVIVNANAYINAQVQVNVGPFNVTFDLGGVTIKPTFNAPSGGSQTPSTPYLPPGTTITNNYNYDEAPSTVNCKPTDLTTVISKLDAIKTQTNDIQDCSCPVTTSPSTVSLGSGVDGYVALPSNTISVALNVTTVPANAKTQKSNGSEPLNYFIGYVYWGDGTSRTQRIPVSFRQSVFYPPLWATAFGWNLYLGCSGTATATKLTPSKSGAVFGTLQMKNAAK